MALPEGFGSTREYFSDVLNLLYDYQWLYIQPNTDIFKSKVFDSVSSNWNVFFQSELTDESIESLGLGIEIPNAPNSLNNFIKQIKKLTPNHNLAKQHNIDNVTTGITLTKGLGIKKQHEIALLAPLIHNFCLDSNIDYVVDIGCGLGYLTNLLAEKKINIIGIDGNAKFINTAKDKYPSIAFEHLFVNTESSEDIKRLLNRHFINFDEKLHKICLVALHACADLTVDMLKLSLSMDCLKKAIVMPCCYHRMKLKDDTNEGHGKPHQNQGFLNFPLSHELKEVVNNLGVVDKNKENGKDIFLNGTFLRLACQRADWKNQTKENRIVQTNNLMFRNLLQLVVDKENLCVQRRRRKTGSNRGDYTIDSFLTSLETSYEITSLTTEGVKVPIARADEQFLRIKDEVKRNYDQIYAQQTSTLAAFVALQNLIQPVCENLVLLDRCVFVAQQGENTQCVTVKVTDECISPRCYALVVTKVAN